MGGRLKVGLLHLPRKATQIVVRPCRRDGTPDQRADFYAVGAISPGKSHWEVFAKCRTEREAERIANQFRACLA